MEFHYAGNSSLWSLWLRVPVNARIAFYRFLFLFSNLSHDTRRLPFGLFAKFGDRPVIQEAFTTQMVTKYTDIPVPIVLDVLRHPSCGAFFIMTALPGTALSKMPLTLDHVSPEQLTAFADTLREWMNQLHYLRSPFDRRICGYFGGPFQSNVIDTTDLVGPYPSQSAFHDEPCCALSLETHHPDVCALASIIRQKTYDISLVHGDLSPDNILVDKNYTPTALINWGCGAFMPEYWDLVAAVCRRDPVCPAWHHVFIRAIPQYPNEIRVHNEIAKFYTPITL